MEFRNKTALVTGASTGIGQAIAIELASKGTTVFITARHGDKLNKTKELIEKEGGKAEIIIADLAKVQTINSLISTIKEKTETLDFLINVAGIWHNKKEVFAGKGFKEFSQEAILDTFTVGLTAPTLLSHGLMDIMPRGSSIINISGTFENGAKGWLPYYVSKKGIEDLTVGLAEELKDKRINVNCISPSDTATESYKEFFPDFIKDAIEPVEVAKYAVHLCSSFNTTGKVFVVKKGTEPYEGFHN